MGSIGAVDDWLKLKWKNTKGLSPRKKMIYQTLITFFVVLMMSTNGFSLGGEGPHVVDFASKEGAVTHSLASAQSLFFLPFFHTSFQVPQEAFWGLICGVFLFVFFWFVITGSSNAVNLTDGLDGLAGGLTFIVSGALVLVSVVSGDLALSHDWNWIYVEGAHNVGLFLAALMGSCLGFLWYNAYPAQVFMGDTGSLGIGGVLGICSILMRQELFFALAGFVFVVETLSVVLQVWSFRRYKKRIFLCSPLHHHFEYQGLLETKVVMRFWIAGLGCAVVALLSVFSRG
jgi:phospho-N-acetylmuramoyl-pentapeptide-transferase